MSDVSDAPGGAVPFPIGAPVECVDGPAGKSTALILDPIKERVTHLVVRESGLLGVEHVVALEDVLESSADGIKLRIDRKALGEAPSFVSMEYLPSPNPLLGMPDASMWMLPYTPLEPALLAIPHEHIPPGEVEMRRSDDVEAKDGHVGQVDEFLVNPTNGGITHLVMREGHLWGQKDVTIPVAQILRIAEGVVYLKLTKAEVEALPTVPVHRRSA